MTVNCVDTISCKRGDAVTTIASDRPADATTGIGSPGRAAAAESLNFRVARPPLLDEGAAVVLGLYLGHDASLALTACGRAETTARRRERGACALAEGRVLRAGRRRGCRGAAWEAGAAGIKLNFLPWL